MNIKDIVNRDAVNLTNCDQEPIHIPGSIQPHGFLLAMNADTLIIDYCSGNIAEYIGITYEQCLGKPLGGIFGAGAAQQFLTYMSGPRHAVIPPLLMQLNGRELLCSAYRSEDLYIAEFETAEQASADISAVYNQTIQFVSYMERSVTLKDLCSRVADETRAITGYDRVMVYRFDKDYNGEVFAESKADHIEPFLGLHYPHTDIPAQARRLYLTNLMRIIVDINYTPVPLYTIDNGMPQVLDLSRSYLRSVSPIHVEYLSNMGVGGTLTISLIHDSRLWGLITCHHYSAKYVPLYSRIAAQLQGSFLTSQINVRQLNEEHKMTDDINTALEKLLDEQHEPAVRSFSKIISNPHLLTLCGAGGVAIIFEGKVYSSGNTPSDEQIRALISAVSVYARHGEFSTSCLADIYPEAKKFAATGAGIIYRSLNALQDDVIIWFLPETQEEVNWAGDPSLAILKTEKVLSPRNSFQLWKQKVRYQSREWRTPELLATSSYTHTLQRHITMILVSEEEKKQRELSAQLQEANAELENINWISSHDLKEPLRKILMFSSRILDKEQQELSDTVVLSLSKVKKSADRMQQLLADMTMYNKVRHQHDAFEIVDLDLLMQQVYDELADELTEKDATLSYGPLPVIRGIPFLLRQLFLNLVRNSLKFAKKEAPPVITITAASRGALAAGDERIFDTLTVRDNGIGFDDRHAESIFKVFTRLHVVADYEGSGVGLALCRKIMQNHKGYIRASGEPGIGATFTLHFPVHNDTGMPVRQIGTES